MSSEEFVHEVLESDCCPENFEQIYEEFRFYQKLATDTLCAFHNVCERNNIPYQLAFGSLLGAIRDNGQIPWDYDVDVFVPYCYKDDVVAALKADLDKDYYFYCPEIDAKCRHFFIRLAPKGYRTEAIHVDVFYLIGSPDNENERRSFGKRVDKLFYMRYKKLVDIRENSYGKVKKLIKLLIKRLQVMNISIKTISKKFDKLCTQYDYYSSKISVPPGAACVRRFDTKKIWETSLLKTDIGTFKIPDNYDEVLKSIYGDYMKKPKLESRLKEMLSSYKMLKYFDEK